MDGLDQALSGLKDFPLLAAIGAAIAAMAALGVAAMGLVDTSKAFWGGISNLGFGHIERAVTPFAGVMRRAVGGPDWADIMRAQWRNGRDKEDQKAVVRSLMRLGLTEGAVEELAHIANVDRKVLEDIATRLREGLELTDQHMGVLGRVDSVIGARIDAAFERADQQYRNGARVAAALVALVLSLAAGATMAGGLEKNGALAVLVGLLAVPIAPVAKDLISSLSASARALKAAKAI